MAPSRLNFEALEIAHFRYVGQTLFCTENVFCTGTKKADSYEVVPDGGPHSE